MERYAFIFDYNGDFMIVLYENGVNVKYFNSAENGWDNSLDYTNLFVGKDGTKYYYMFDNCEKLLNIDIFSLGNKPIECLSKYLLK